MLLPSAADPSFLGHELPLLLLCASQHSAALLQCFGAAMSSAAELALKKKYALLKKRQVSGAAGGLQAAPGRVHGLHVCRNQGLIHPATPGWPCRKRRAVEAAALQVRRG